MHVITHPELLQPLAVQWPPQFDIVPQPWPQEDMHILVHTSVHAELPQPWPHVVKQLLIQLTIHQPEHERSELLLPAQLPVQDVQP